MLLFLTFLLFFYQVHSWGVFRATFEFFERLQVGLDESHESYLSTSRRKILVGLSAVKRMQHEDDRLSVTLVNTLHRVANYTLIERKKAQT